MSKYDWKIPDISQSLKQEKIGIFPCDTIWGIIGIASSNIATLIRAAKGRTEEKGFIILIPDISFLDKCVSQVPESAQQLIDQYWPGPLTLIFDKHPSVDPVLTGGRSTIAIRYPRYKPLNDLLDHVKIPLISTSANLSSNPTNYDLTTIPHTLTDLMTFIYKDCIPPLQQESTIVNTTKVPISVVRQGDLQLSL